MLSGESLDEARPGEGATFGAGSAESLRFGPPESSRLTSIYPGKTCSGEKKGTAEEESSTSPTLGIKEPCRHPAPATQSQPRKRLTGFLGLGLGSEQGGSRAPLRRPPARQAPAVPRKVPDETETKADEGARGTLRRGQEGSLASSETERTISSLKQEQGLRKSDNTKELVATARAVPEAAVTVRPPCSVRAQGTDGGWRGQASAERASGPSRRTPEGRLPPLWGTQESRGPQSFHSTA